jgi:hypothetical protein
MKKSSLKSVSILSAVAPFFWCWGSAMLAGMAGVTGAFSWFAWLHPLRSYLCGIAFVSLGFSFYKTYRPKRNNQGCGQCKKIKTVIFKPSFSFEL